MSVDDSDDAADARRRDRSERNTPPLGGVDFLAARIQACEIRLDGAISGFERAERAAASRREQNAVDRAMLWGADGQPGRLGALEGRMTALEARATSVENRVGVIETWRTAFMAKIAISIAIGTTVAGVLTALLVKWVSFR